MMPGTHGSYPAYQVKFPYQNGEYPHKDNTALCSAFKDTDIGYLQ